METLVLFLMVLVLFGNITALIRKTKSWLVFSLICSTFLLCVGTFLLVKDPYIFWLASLFFALDLILIQIVRRIDTAKNLFNDSSIAYPIYILSSALIFTLFNLLGVSIYEEVYVEAPIQYGFFESIEANFSSLWPLLIILTVVSVSVFFSVTMFLRAKN